MYVNVGVTSGIRPVKSKKALRDAINDGGADLRFFGTSEFTPFDGGVDDLVTGIRYSVVGPDPYVDRKWYATVEKGVNGKIKVT